MTCKPPTLPNRLYHPPSPPLSSHTFRTSYHPSACSRQSLLCPVAPGHPRCILRWGSCVTCLRKAKSETTKKMRRSYSRGRENPQSPFLSYRELVISIMTRAPYAVNAHTYACVACNSRFRKTRVSAIQKQHSKTVNMPAASQPPACVFPSVTLKHSNSSLSTLMEGGGGGCAAQSVPISLFTSYLHFVPTKRVGGGTHQDALLKKRHLHLLETLPTPGNRGNTKIPRAAKASRPSAPTLFSTSENAIQARGPTGRRDNPANPLPPPRSLLHL